jgi:hypothetical protein
MCCLVDAIPLPFAKMRLRCRWAHHLRLAAQRSCLPIEPPNHRGLMRSVSKPAALKMISDFSTTLPRFVLATSALARQAGENTIRRARDRWLCFDSFHCKMQLYRDKDIPSWCPLSLPSRPTRFGQVRKHQSEAPRCFYLVSVPNDATWLLNLSAAGPPVLCPV